jgi:hypothetical protein
MIQRDLIPGLGEPALSDASQRGAAATAHITQIGTPLTESADTKNSFQDRFFRQYKQGGDQSLAEVLISPFCFWQESQYLERYCTAIAAFITNIARLLPLYQYYS